MPAVTAVRGFKDILPQDIPYYTLIEEAMRKMAFRYNYQEIRPPILERTGLFQRSIGETTDIVEKEMYTFPDRHGDLLTMRPEATAGIVRALIENNLLTEGRALKLFTMGPMFRYERPQKGRLRQFNQLDVEVFGDPGPYVDAEVIDLLRGILELVGLKELTVHINSLGCPVCRPGYREKLTAFLLKRKDKLCPDCQRRLSEIP
jgi:histidyl-tRNA synthetase